MKTMICQSCGKECERTSNVQKFCPECRVKKQEERNAAYAKRKAAGSVKAIGSAEICPSCGSSFIRTSGNQGLCPSCIKKGVSLRSRKLSDLPEEKRQEEYQKTSRIKNQLYDSVLIYVPKGRKADLQKLTKSLGISLNKFINEAIEFYEQVLEEDSLG